VDYSKVKTFVTEHLTLYSAILIFIGYWNLHSYYMFFGINIYNYITTTEILLSFLPALFRFLILSISIIVLYLCYSFFAVGMANVFADIKLKPIWLHLSIISTALLLFCSLFIFINLSSISFNYQNYPAQYYILFVTLLVLSFIILAYSDYNEEFNFWVVFKKHIKKTILYFVCISLLYVLFNENYIEADLIKNNKPRFEFSFVSDSIKYSSSTELVYLGETQNYVILRNNNSKFNLFFKKDKIEKYMNKEIECNTFFDTYLFNKKLMRK